MFIHITAVVRDYVFITGPTQSYNHSCPATPTFRLCSPSQTRNAAGGGPDGGWRSKHAPELEHSGLPTPFLTVTMMFLSPFPNSNRSHCSCLNRSNLTPKGNQSKVEKCACLQQKQKDPLQCLISIFSHNRWCLELMISWLFAEQVGELLHLLSQQPSN